MIDAGLRVWFALSLLLLVTIPRPLTAQTVQKSWRETLQLEVPLLVAKRLENARGLIEQEQWAAALQAFSDLETDFPARLVKVSEGRYLSVPLAVRLLRIQLPAEGLEVYRQQIDGWAQQQLTLAESIDDVAALDRIVTTALASRVGDDALNQLAEQAWEQGDIPRARQLWTRMIPVPVETQAPLLVRYPHTDHKLADIYARLVLCSLAEGNSDRADKEWQQFTELFPEAEGTLAGEQGNLSDILEELLANPHEWLAPSADLSTPTFAATPFRNEVHRRSVRLGPAVWTLPLNPVYVPRWERPRQALPERGVLSRHAVTFENGVFVHDGTTVLGLRLEDGKPLWPLDVGDRPDETPGKVYPPFPAIANSLPWTPVVGVPRYTSTVHLGRFYALLGPSVLTLPGGHETSTARLICLNLADGEGLLEWFQTPEELFAPGWQVTGTPVADGERLFVPLVRSNPQVEVAVACLNARDGQVIWQQTIGQALRTPLARRVELGHQLLTLANDRVIFATGYGGIATLQANNGQIDWVVTYPSSEREAVDRSDEHQVGLLPPLVHEGTAYVHPADSDELLAIDIESGFVFWRRATPGPVVHLLGAGDSTLLISGPQLWGIDVDTGQTQWRFGYDDATASGYGRGVVIGDRVYWTTQEELFVVDRETGQAVQRVPLFDALGVTGGNLIAAENRLLIAGPNHLTAFELLP